MTLVHVWESKCFVMFSTMSYSDCEIDKVFRISIDCFIYLFILIKTAYMFINSQSLFIRNVIHILKLGMILCV